MPLKVVQFQDRVKIVAGGLHKHFIMFGTTIRGPIIAAGIVRVALSLTIADSMLTGKAERSKQTEKVIEKASASEYLKNFEAFALKLTNSLQETVHWCSESDSAAARQKGSGKLFIA